MRCDGCRWSLAVDDNQLECHRGPPQMVTVSVHEGQQVAAGWPVVPPDAWCGEYDSATQPGQGLADMLAADQVSASDLLDDLRRSPDVRRHFGWGQL